MEIGTTYQVTTSDGQFFVGTLLAFDMIPDGGDGNGPRFKSFGRFNVKADHAESITNVALDSIVRYTAEIEV